MSIKSLDVRMIDKIVPLDLPNAKIANFTTGNAIATVLSADDINVKRINLPKTGGNFLNDADFFGNLTVHGTLTALSGVVTIETITSTTSTLSVVNTGPDTSVYVEQVASINPVLTLIGSGAKILNVNNVEPLNENTGIEVFWPGTGHTLVAGNTESSTAFVITSSGNVGIGTSTPDTTLEVNGSLNVSTVLLSSNVDLGDIFTNKDELAAYSSVVNDLITTVVEANSASWGYQATDLKSLTGKWEDTVTYVQNSSAVTLLSSSWQDATTVVRDNSATNWNYQGTDLKALTGNWEATYTTVSSLSTSWSAAKGAVGGGTDKLIYENDQVMTADYTITVGKNGMSAGPITISNGVILTVPDGSTYTVV